MNFEDYTFRFGGVSRLFGEAGALKIQNSNIMVIGLGGVGSWTVESLARSGVEKLTLVDFDDICISNFNRQIHAIEGEVGKLKSQVLKSRILKINPKAQVTILDMPFSWENREEIFREPVNVVVDAMDSLKEKCDLIRFCQENGIPLVTVGGTAGKWCAQGILVDDLAFSTNDSLLQRVRKRLRQKHGFSRDLKQPFGVRAIYSKEQSKYPDGKGGVTCAPNSSAGGRMPLDCNTGLGSMAAVTGSFGFVASGEAIHLILNSN